MKDMILKVRSKHIDTGISWKLIDNIKEIHYEYLLYSAVQGRINKDNFPSYQFLHYRCVHPTDCECESCKSTQTGCECDSCFGEYEVVLLTLEKNDGTFLYVVTDDVAYILNDEGKTIDGVYT